MQASIAGSGNISDIHILGQGMLSIAGSGDIRVKAKNPSSVMKQVAGSGSIKVKQL